MERAELSKIYGGACNRMHEAVTHLYEALHDYQGDPHIDVGYVVDRVSEYRRWLLIEADMIREAVKEFHE
jgi:hypothetical protein